MTSAAAWGQAFWGRDLVAVEWRKLCYVTYSVDPARLATKLLPGLSLQLHEGGALLNLVFWQAQYPSVLGFKPAQPLSSTELALRYLVCEGPRRGVVTLHEDSSSAAVALAARTLFREPTRHTPMGFVESSRAELLELEYEAEFAERSHKVQVKAKPQPVEAGHDTVAYAMVQRPFVYSRAKDGSLARCDLDHPAWRVHEVVESQIDVDYGALYGEEWADLSTRAPLAVTLVEGSTVRATLPE